MRASLGFTLTAIIAGAWFFYSLGTLWPLADVDLNRPRGLNIEDARAFLQGRGFSLDGYQATARLRVEERTLDYLEAHLSHDQIQAVLRADATLVRYQVFFKKPGEPRMYSLSLRPSGEVVAWNSSWREEREGARMEAAEARQLAEREVAAALAIDFSAWEVKGERSQDQPNRRSHAFSYERVSLQEPELRERLHISVEGDVVAGAYRTAVVPEDARLLARTREAPSQALQIAGYFALGLAGIMAVWVFLRKLQAGSVSLRHAAMMAIAAFLLGTVTQALQGPSLFIEWDPLWPRWVSWLHSMLYRSITNLAILFLVLVVIAAGDALDREDQGLYGKELRLIGSGRFFHPVVAIACARGFGLGLICGAVLTFGGYFPQLFGIGHVSIQPRGFFFYALNADSPAFATIFFFLGIALIEEGGYRYFGGQWLDRATRRRWLAILLPGLVYGISHTILPFLPPAEPFWARPLVMTLVGCVWGWGFFRFGALAVIVSHFTADLFIFNWPRLASGDAHLVTIAVLTIAVPLIPMLGFIRPARKTAVPDI